MNHKSDYHKLSLNPAKLDWAGYILTLEWWATTKRLSLGMMLSHVYMYIIYYEWQYKGSRNAKSKELSVLKLPDFML